jgi:hypothetical protein
MVADTGAAALERRRGKCHRLEHDRAVEQDRADADRVAARVERGRNVVGRVARALQQGVDIGRGQGVEHRSSALDTRLGAVQRLRALVDVGADLHVAAGEPERGDAQAEQADHQHHHQKQDRAALGVAVGAS